MKSPLPTAWSAWFKIVLILAGLCCSWRVAVAEEGARQSVSEDALGFGESGIEAAAPVDGSNRAGVVEGAKPVQTSPSARGGGKGKAIQGAPAGGGINRSETVEKKPTTEHPMSPPAALAGVAKAGGDSATARVPDTASAPSLLLKMSREDLFQRIFAKSLPERLRDPVVHLVVDNENLEQVRIHWDEKFEDFQFHSVQLKAFLDSSLLWSEAERRPLSVETFTGAMLKERRFGVRVDESEFSLFLTIPPELKKRRVRKIDDPSSEAVYGTRVVPAKFSAYLNSRWENAWIYRERFFPDDSARVFWEHYNGNEAPERQPWNGELDGAVRAWNWVLLGTGSLKEADTGSRVPLQAERKETKLVYDFVPWNSRLTFLDVSPRHLGGNYSLPGLLGVDLEIGSALYSRRSDERAKVDFFLARPADVTVYVNGEPVRAMQLGSGSQTIEGISGRPGRNVGDMQIIYPDGRLEHIPFEFIQSSPEVLPEGRQEGSFSTGVRRIGSDSYGASLGDFVVAGTYQRGMSPFMDIKLGTAVSKGLQVANLGFLLIEDSVTKWSLVSTFSLDSVYHWGQRHDLQYALKIPNGSLLGRVSYVQTRFWNSFFTPVTRQKVAVEAGMNVSRGLWKGAVSSDLIAQFNRKLDSATNPIDYHWNLSYSLHAYRGLNVRASAGFAVSSGEYAPSVSLTANYFFSAGRHSLYAMNQTSNQKRYVAPKLEQSRHRDSLIVGGTFVFVDRDSSKFVPGTFEYAWRNQSTAGWSWSEGLGMTGGKSVSLTGTLAPDQYGLQFSGQKTLNIADLGVSYSLTDQNRKDIMSRSHYAVGHMSTSLMFADGVFAIGRPVREGFALVKGKQDLADAAFRINPSDQNASQFSHGGRWNAASYGMMSAYQTENIQVVPDHSPGAVNLDGNLFRMDNTYHQGYLLRLGRPAQVFVRLRLIDQANLPLKHTTFQVFSVVDSVVPLYRSFSNDDGVVQIGGLEAGRTYNIRFGEDAFVKDLRITVPKSASRMLDMGDVKVENQSLSQLSKVSMLTQPELRRGDPVQGVESPTQRTPTPAASAADGIIGKGVN